MTRKEFREMFQRLVDIVEARFEKKNHEYATEGDAYSSLKDGAQIARVEFPKYIWVLASKHVDSILNFTGDESEKVIDEKFGDLALYVMLHWAYAKKVSIRKSIENSKEVSNEKA